MATLALFIHPEEIKNTTYIDENVDVKILQNLIIECQEMYLHQILGTGLFNELKTEVNAGSVSSANQTLLNDYIQPALKYLVLYEGVEVLTYKIANKAILKPTAENAEPIVVNDMNLLKGKFLKTAEYYSHRITDYLIANLTTFPLYSSPGSSSDTIYPKRELFEPGFYLGGSEIGTDIDKMEYPSTFAD